MRLPKKLLYYMQDLAIHPIFDSPCTYLFVFGVFNLKGFDVKKIQFCIFVDLWLNLFG